MKTCPKCNLSYADETLNFCLEDGEWLIAEEAGEGPVTAVMPGEDATRRWSPTTSERSMSSAEYLVRGLSRNKKAAIITAVVFAVLAVGASYAIYTFRNGTDNTPRSIKIEKLTTDGKAASAAISPDGKDIVYSVDEGGAQSMWRKQVATGSSVQIIPATNGVEYAGIRFTPDGNLLTFLKRDKTSTHQYTLHQMPLLGGGQKPLIKDVDGAVSFSPDGKQFVFLRGNFPEMGQSAILIANGDGTGERTLVQRQRPETFPWTNFETPVWAPDGKSIACIIGGDSTGAGLMDVAEVKVEDGSIKPITKKGWYQIKSIAWMPDKTGLLVMGAEKSSDYFTQQISHLSYPEGEVRKITPGFDNYVGMNLSADGRSLAAVQSNRISNIWTVPNAEANRARQIRAGGGNQEGTDGVYCAPDGRIIFYSKASGADDIWIMNGDGSGVKQLTVDAGVNYDPVVTADGSYVVFNSERDGQINVWRMDLDGGNVKQLTSGKNSANISVTPDSKWIFFDSTASGSQAIWKIPIDGGEPIQVTQRITENPEVSPDGKSFVSQFRENVTAPWRYALFNIDGGEPLKVFDLPGREEGFRWSPDGRSINQEQTIKGVTNIWRYPLDGGQPKQVTDFANDQIFNFRWCGPDAKSLVLARGTVMSDVVLIRDF